MPKVLRKSTFHSITIDFPGPRRQSKPGSKFIDSLTKPGEAAAREYCWE